MLPMHFAGQCSGPSTWYGNSPSSAVYGDVCEDSLAMPDSTAGYERRA
jgi:hypothetical protein